MSVPKMTAKLRTKNNVPFAIETLSGKQFRCGICGKVYWHRDELNLHMQKEKEFNYEKLQFPELDKNITVSVIYTQDLHDLTNTKYPRLAKGDELFKQNKTE